MMAVDLQFVARMLTASASGYAAAAANRLLEEHPETAGRFGDRAFGDWKAHLEQRVAELAAALLAEDAELFVSEVAWSAAAFQARQVPESDLQASLECLRDVLDDELPEGVSKDPLRYLDLGLAALKSESQPRAREPSPQSETSLLGLAYLEAALSGERREAVKSILSAVEGGLPPREAFEALMLAQRQVGELWHAHEVGVAQEHFVTETTRSVMALLTQRAQCEKATGKTVVVALAPGNLHDMGARVVAAFFELEGWRTIHLAGPTPPDELALGLEVFEADLLALSMSLPTQLEATIAVVESARAARTGVKILVGGRSLVLSSRIRERLGADAYCETADEGPRVGARLVGLEPSGG